MENTKKSTPCKDTHGDIIINYGIKIKSNHSFGKRLWLIFTNPFRYLIKGEIQY